MTHVEAQRTRDGAWKVRIIVGFAGLIFGLAMVYFYHFYIGVGLIVFGAGYVIKSTYLAIDAYQHSRLNIRAHRAEVETLENQSNIIETRHGLIIKHGFQFHFIPPTAIERNKVLQPHPLQLPAPELPKLYPLLAKAQRILIAGGMTGGKTTVCQWIAYQKLQQGRVIVIDSHAIPARWPSGCEVIGAGRDYGKIEALLEWLMSEMDRRFKEQARGVVGERGHEIISLISDEWTILPDVIPKIEQYTTPLLTETRKAGYDFYLAAHDTTVGALGIKGKGGLRKAFDFAVLCNHDLLTDERRTFVNFMKGGAVLEKDNVEYESPGPFVVNRVALPGLVDNEYVIELPEVEPVINGQAKQLKGMALLRASDEEILRLYDEGMTKPSYISKEILSYSKQSTINYIIQILAENDRQLTD